MSADTVTVVPDIIKPNLTVLFCGINPGLVSAATKSHYAHPGNKFWKALHLSGFTPRLYSPSEQANILELDLGLTNFVARPSATAKVLSTEEYRKGTVELKKKIKRFSPKWLAVLGIEAYRKGFGIPFATLGKQPQAIGTTKIWLLPSPSGLNAHYQLSDFIALFTELREQIEQEL